ncbi:MAG TPA: HEPN domain-containing protein [Polyangiaceae bacterium]|nr:HEPN domain-containing protein [Polyangiaceae bacterium]
MVAIFREAVPQGLLVLFGSHARGDWVDDEATGYKSDFDLLAVVREPAQADDVALWHGLEARLRAAAAPSPVTLIAHDIKFVNREVRMGQYFFADIVKEGVLLYAGQKLDFATPKALNPNERLATGEYNFGYWFDSASGFFRGCRYFIGQGRPNHAAFLLHQAAERYYHTASLVFTGYKERTHDLNALGQKAAEQHPRLVEALPKTEPEDKRLHDLLRKAYIEARYSKSYRITLAELAALQVRVLGLAARVREACLEKLASHCGPEAVRPSLPVPPALDEPLPAGLPPPPDDPAELGRWAKGLAELAELRAREGELRGREAGLREGEARGREAGLREGEARAVRRLVVKRLGRPLRDDEERVLGQKIEALGAEGVEDAALGLGPAELAAWLAGGSAGSCAG